MEVGGLIWSLICVSVPADLLRGVVLAGILTCLPGRDYPVAYSLPTGLPTAYQLLATRAISDVHQSYATYRTVPYQVAYHPGIP